MITKTYQLETLTCPSCTMKIEASVKKMIGVEKVEVLFNSSRVKVSFDEAVQNSDEIKNTIEKVGFDVLGIK
ncbi:cation transporter [Alkaliphilus sp. MSJ-5]|uniref:Cation transporter n=1 Tax=Alkaliphilus flagellatus TaxID=2841507 RepID=A0ABS6G3Z4_9FIRM|nr:heavy-metal-associated domain-containing protein [Alkaliphilus flagellatus]MBU5677211.1 cation transporter [Alkaliphilus flagellatus]